MHARSLDSLHRGEIACVDHILFDAVRNHCAERGIREGARVSGASVDGENVLVETASGPVPCERRYARFVQVRPAENPLGGAHGADCPTA